MSTIFSRRTGEGGRRNSRGFFRSIYCLIEIGIRLYVVIMMVISERSDKTNIRGKRKTRPVKLIYVCAPCSALHGRHWPRSEFINGIAKGRGVEVPHRRRQSSSAQFLCEFYRCRGRNRRNYEFKHKHRTMWDQNRYSKIIKSRARRASGPKLGRRVNACVRESVYLFVCVDIVPSAAAGSRWHAEIGKTSAREQLGSTR